MDQDLERLRTIFEADITRFERAMNTYANRTEAAARRAEKSFGDANKKIAASTDQMARDVRRAVVGLALAIGGREVLQYEEQWRNTVNTLNQYTAVLGEAGQAATDLNQIAYEAAVPLASLGNLTGAAARAAKELGKSRKDVLDFVDSVSKGAQIANNGAAAVQGAIVQLSQAIASPRVQLGEFNSIVEGTPRLAQAFAEGIDKAGGSVARLRQLIASGDISGEELFAGLLSQTEKLRTEFDGMTTGVTEAFIRLQNKLVEFVGSNETVKDSVQGLAKLIEGAADNLDLFAQAAVVAAAVIGGALAGQALEAGIMGFGRITKGATAATAAVRMFGIIAGVFGGPVPLLIGAIAGAFVLLAQNGTRLTRAMEEVGTATAGANKALAATEKYVDADLLTQLGDSAETAAPKVGILGGKLREVADALKDATIQQFLQELLDLQTQISTASAAIEEAQAAREKERRRTISNAGLGTQARAAAGQDVGDLDTGKFDQAISDANAALFNLQKRQTQIGISVFGEGRGKEFTDALLSGDIGAASELLRKRLDQLTGGAGGDAPTTPADNKEAIKAAEQVLDQLAKAYRDTFETEREALARIRDERLAAIDLVAKSEADREKRRKEALDLYAIALEEVDIAEIKADQEAFDREAERERLRLERIDGEKAALAEVIDARDRMFGRVQQIAAREYELRQAEIKREITDKALQQEALLALEEEYGEQRRQAREQLLSLGDPEGALETEISRIRRAEEAKLAALKDGLAARLIVEEEYEAERQRLSDETDRQVLEARRAATSAQLTAYEGLFSNVGELFKQLGGEQSKAARVALAISRAFAIADSTIKIAQATSQVLADPTQVTLPQKIAAAGVIAAQGASIIAAIAGGGKGFAQGGYVTGPGGPRTDSIPARLSNGEFVVNADATRANRQLLEAINAGRSIPMAMAQPVLRAPNVTVNNNAPGTLARAQRNGAGEIEVIIDAIAQDISRGGGRIGMAMEGRYGVNPAWGT